MLLVTGATGNIGRELVRELDARGAAAPHPGARPRPRGRPAGTGRARRRRPGQPATLAPAFDGVERLFLLTRVSASSTPNTPSPPRRRPGCGTSCTCRPTPSSATRCPPWAAGTTSAKRSDPRLRHPRHVPAALRLHDQRLRLAAHPPRGRLRPRPGRPGPLRADRSRGHRRGRRRRPDRGRPRGPGVPVDRRRDIHRRGAGPDPGQGDRSRHRGPRRWPHRPRRVRFRYPHGAPQALADALIEGLTLMRADTVGVRTRHRTAPARARAADLRGLVRAQRRRVPRTGHRLIRQPPSPNQHGRRLNPV